MTQWITDFDEQMEDLNSPFYYDSEGGYAEGIIDPSAVKSFIQQEKDKSYEEGRTEQLHSYFGYTPAELIKIIKNYHELKSKLNDQS